VEKIKIRQGVVVSVIVTCSSGLTLYFAADWSVAQHSCAYDPMGVQTFKRSTFNVQRSNVRRSTFNVQHPLECLVTAIITDQ
jgi:hypothetical protein